MNLGSVNHVMSILTDIILPEVHSLKRHHTFLSVLWCLCHLPQKSMPWTPMGPRRNRGMCSRCQPNQQHSPEFRARSPQPGAQPDPDAFQPTTGPSERCKHLTVLHHWDLAKTLTKNSLMDLLWELNEYYMKRLDKSKVLILVLIKEIKPHSAKLER